MSDKRKCTFTIETGPISARSFDATASLLRTVAPVIAEGARADVKVTCTPGEPSAQGEQGPESRILDRTMN
jgi:hypothetical protein